MSGSDDISPATGLSYKQLGSLSPNPSTRSSSSTASSRTRTVSSNIRSIQGNLFNGGGNTSTRDVWGKRTSSSQLVRTNSKKTEKTILLEPPRPMSAATGTSDGASSEEAKSESSSLSSFNGIGNVLLLSLDLGERGTFVRIPLMASS